MKHIITLLLSFIFILGCNPNTPETIYIRGFKSLHAINLVMASMIPQDYGPHSPLTPEDVSAVLRVEIATLKLEILDLKDRLSQFTQPDYIEPDITQPVLQYNSREFVKPYVSIRQNGRKPWLCRDGTYRTDRLPLLSRRLSRPTCIGGRCY